MMIRQRLSGVAALTGLVGLLAGLPAVLLALGWGSLPASLDGWLLLLTSPDDGHLVVLILTATAWLVWLLLAGMIITEVLAAARLTRRPRLRRGLRWGQLPIRKMVAAAALLFVAVPSVAAPASAAPALGHTATHTVASQVRAHTAPAVSPKADASAASETHTVVAGDTLWGIAEARWGAGDRYPLIVAANPTLFPSGAATPLQIGWVLTLPAAPTDLPGTLTVQPGDTLSGLAERYLGDADQWRAIFDASTGLPQPDGRQLTNPDLILPGWHLQLPSSPGTAGQPTTAPADDPAPASPTPVPPTAGPSSPAGTNGTATPAAAATAPAPAPSAAASVPGAPTASTDATPVTAAPAPWLLAGLTGAGAVLSAGLLRVLQQRRRAQRAARRPGRTISVPGPDVAPVERTVLHQASAATPTLHDLDQALRSLATAGTGRLVPRLRAVEVAADVLRVHLATPATLVAPWVADDEAGLVWRLDRTMLLPTVSLRPAWPQLVTIGQGDDGSLWLVNLEELGRIRLCGQPEFAGDLVRYLAAEIAVNPWAAHVTLDCVGVAPEAALLDPARIRYRPADAAGEVAGETVTGSVATVDRCTAMDVDAPTGRAGDVGDDTWPSRIVMIDASLIDPTLEQLLALIGHQPGHTGTSVVLDGDQPGGTDDEAVEVVVSADGRVTIAALGLDLIAVGLTPDEAQGCAQLLTIADQDDTSMPPATGDGWQASCDNAGALRADLVLPRNTPTEQIGEPVTSMLPAPDADLVAVAATTVADLAQLAPLVPATVRRQVEAADPTLDADLAVWRAGTGPRLRLLGPVEARVGATGKPAAAAKRKAFFTEILAFLALHPNGVTTDQLADALGTEPAHVRVHVSKVRTWLGTDPSTGEPYLPEATKSPAGLARGLGLYQTVGVLVDVDLFRRLRSRGQARGGSDGETDLRTALELVRGEPFTGLRPAGWSWLAEGERVDQHMVCAIVDVAHTVTIANLHAGDLTAARQAAEIAHRAAPAEDTPVLDLAAVAAAEGHLHEADRVTAQVTNRLDTDHTPQDLPERTAAVLAQAGWRKTSVA